MNGEIGRRIEHGASQIMDTFMISLMQRQDQIRREQEYSQKLHYDIINKLEYGLQKDIQNQNLFIERDGQNLAFKELKDGKLVFQNGEKAVSISSNEIEAAVKIQNTTIKLEGAETPSLSNIESSKSPEVVKTVSEINLAKNSPDHLRNRNEVNVKTENTSSSEQKQILEPQQEIKLREKIETEKENNDVIKTVSVINLNAVTSNNSQNHNEVNAKTSTPSSPELNQELRGKIEAINMLKNMDPKEIRNLMKEAQVTAKEEEKSLPEVYKEKLIERFESSLNQSRKELIQKAELVYGEANKAEKKIDNSLKKISEAIVKLDKSKDLGLIPSEKHAEAKGQLLKEQDTLTKSFDKIEKTIQRLDSQIKTDLKNQFPDLKVQNLNPKQALDIAKAASNTAVRSLRGLKEFAQEQRLDNTLKAINKATKEVEVTIEKTVQVTISR